MSNIKPDPSASEPAIEAEAPLHPSVQLFDYLRDERVIDWGKVRQWELAGADISEINNKWQRNALHILADRDRSLEVIRYALEKGIDPNEPSIGGCTPLWELVTQIGAGNEEEIAQKLQLLIDFGADPEWRTRRISTPLSYEAPLESYTRGQDGRVGPVLHQLLNAGVYLDPISRKHLEHREMRFRWSGRRSVPDEELPPWWEPFREQWDQAKAFAAKPEVAKLTPRILCDLSTLGMLNSIASTAQWKGHEAHFCHIMSKIPPYLCQKILKTYPHMGELVKKSHPTTKIEAIERQNDGLEEDIWR